MGSREFGREISSGAHALPTLSMRRTGYSAWVDLLYAMRLLKALVAVGAKPRAPMDTAWIDEIAPRDAHCGLKIKTANERGQCNR